MHPEIDYTNVRLALLGVVIGLLGLALWGMLF